MLPQIIGLILTIIIASLLRTPATGNLRTVFNPDECKFACWLGLEPGVTTRSEVVKLLIDLNIHYETSKLAVPNDSFVWSMREVRPLVADGPIIVLLEFSQEVVWRVWLLKTKICAAQIINSYGIPDATVVTKALRGLVVDIYYFDEGLTFSGVSETAPYFSSAFVAQEDFLRHYMGQARTVNWDSVSGIYANPC